MELEKSFQLLTSITPVSDNKSRRKPKITKLTLRNKVQRNSSLINLNENLANTDKMYSSKSVHNDEDGEKNEICGQNNEKEYKKVVLSKDKNEKTLQLSNKKKDKYFNSKLNLTYDNTDDSLLTSDCSLESDISKDFKLILTSDDSHDKQEENRNDSRKSTSDIILNSQSNKLINEYDCSSLNDFQPRKIGETITDIIEDITRLSDDCEKKSTNHKSHIPISLFKPNFEHKINEILVPETQENHYKENNVISYITIEESEDESDNIRNEKESQPCRFSVNNVVNITIEQTDIESGNEANKNEIFKKIVTTETEFYQTAVLCKISPEKIHEVNKINFSVSNKIANIDSWILTTLRCDF